MMPRTITLILLVTSAFSIACESSGPTESVPRINPHGRDQSVLTTLQISPSTVTLEEGWTVQLQVFARDQRGELMPAVSGLTFSSSDPGIADVSSSGLVTGMEAGTADISVTKTVAGITLIAAMKATIRQATPLVNVVLRSGDRGWQPSVAHLTAGGTVQWLAGGLGWGGSPQPTLYLLDSGYTIVDSLDLSTGSATRTFLTPGEYRYCSGSCWDAPEFGVVYVH